MALFGRQGLGYLMVATGLILTFAAPEMNLVAIALLIIGLLLGFG